MIELNGQKRSYINGLTPTQYLILKMAKKYNIPIHEVQRFLDENRKIKGDYVYLTGFLVQTFIS